MGDKHTRLSAAEAREKAEECRKMAEQAVKPEHRIMLLHMAETWERIAKSLTTDGGT